MGTMKSGMAFLNKAVDTALGKTPASQGDASAQPTTPTPAPLTEEEQAMLAQMEAEEAARLAAQQQTAQPEPTPVIADATPAVVAEQPTEVAAQQQTAQPAPVAAPEPVAMFTTATQPEPTPVVIEAPPVAPTPTPAPVVTIPEPAPQADEDPIHDNMSQAEIGMFLRQLRDFVVAHAEETDRQIMEIKTHNNNLETRVSELEDKWDETEARVAKVTGSAASSAVQRTWTTLVGDFSNEWNNKLANQAREYGETRQAVAKIMGLHNRVLQLEPALCEVDKLAEQAKRANTLESRVSALEAKTQPQPAPAPAQSRFAPPPATMFDSPQPTSSAPPAAPAQAIPPVSMFKSIGKQSPA